MNDVNNHGRFQILLYLHALYYSSFEHDITSPLNVDIFSPFSQCKKKRCLKTTNWSNLRPSGNCKKMFTVCVGV